VIPVLIFLGVWALAAVAVALVLGRLFRSPRNSSGGVHSAERRARPVELARGQSPRPVVWRLQDAPRTDDRGPR
jgi:hypothetical protein